MDHRIDLVQRYASLFRDLAYGFDNRIFRERVIGQNLG